MTDDCQDCSFSGELNIWPFVRSLWFWPLLVASCLWICFVSMFWPEIATVSYSATELLSSWPFVTIAIQKQDSQCLVSYCNFYLVLTDRLHVPYARWWAQWECNTDKFMFSITYHSPLCFPEIIPDMLGCEKYKLSWDHVLESLQDPNINR